MPVQMPVLNAREVVKTTVPRLTVSSLSDLDCPKKFKDTRIERNWDTSRGPILAVSHGTAVHKVLRSIYLNRRGYELDMTRLEAQARDAVWGTAYPANNDRSEAVARVVQSVRAFVDADDEESIQGTIDLERQGQFLVEDRRTGAGLFVASAKLDRTLVRASEPERGICAETKTTKQRISLQEAFLQLWVFRKMYPRLNFTSWAIEYNFLDSEFRVVREVVDWEDVRGQSVILLRKALRVFQATEYPPIQGDCCTYCRMRETCTTLQDETVDLDALENPELVP